VHRPAWPHHRSHHRSGRRASGMRPTIDSIQRCDPRPILGRSLLDKMAACGWVMRAREAMGGLLARVVATTDHTRPRARTASLSLPSAADRVSVAAGQCNLPQRSMRFLKHHPRSPQTVVLGPEATWGYLGLPEATEATLRPPCEDTSTSLPFGPCESGRAEAAGEMQRSWCGVLPSPHVTSISPPSSIQNAMLTSCEAARIR
jgi:hypothetical protein